MVHLTEMLPKLQIVVSHGIISIRTCVTHVYSCNMTCLYHLDISICLEEYSGHILHTYTKP